MSATAVIGLLAEILLIISQLPQIYKSFKTRSTEDLSLTTIVLVLTGIALWVIYGIIKPYNVIVVANVLSLIAFSIVLYAKVKFSK